MGMLGRWGLVACACTVVACGLLLQARSTAADFRTPLSDEEVDKIAAQWDEQEDEDPDDEEVIAKKKMEASRNGNGLSMEDIKKMKGPDVSQQINAAQKKDKMTMLFVSMNPVVKSKEEMETLSQRWTGMLANNQVNVKAYPIEDKKLLYVINDGSQGTELINFLIQQSEVDIIEVDSQKTYGKKSWSKKNPKKVKAAAARQEAENKKKTAKYDAKKKYEDDLKAKGIDPFKEGLKKKKKKGTKKKKKKKTKKGKSARGGKRKDEL